VFSDSTVGFDANPPGIGEHNEEIYGGLLGYSEEQLVALRAVGAI
jgi:crotonobetainyl-CoA:carnitine CoA-transferase CaiB-like acyl-CoA transferase